MYDEFEITDEDLQGAPAKPARKINWRSWLKKLAIVLAFLIFIAGSFLVFNLFRVTKNPFGFGQLKGEADGRVNIMLLGVGDPGHAGEKLSDTNILLSVNTKTHQVSTISVPRDLRVQLPNGDYGKINNANAEGGVKGSKKVFEDTLGVPVHYYVRADFTALKQVVDAVGGVDVNNPDNLYDPEYPCDNNEGLSCGFRLSKGVHHLNGDQALKYVRCRKGTCGDDFGRAARQQEVMQSIRSNATKLGVVGNPVRIAKIINALGDNVTTDLSPANLIRLNNLTKDTDKSKIISVVFNLDPDNFLVSSNSSSDLLPKNGSFDDIQNFVRNIFTVGPIWSEHPNVAIQNGTTTLGLAGKLNDKIDGDGFNINIVSVGNALRRDYTTSQIIDYSNGSTPNTISYFENMLHVKAQPPTTPLKNPPYDVLIILGSDYAQSQASSSQSGSSSN